MNNDRLYQIIEDTLHTASIKAMTIQINDFCPLTGQEFTNRVVDKESITSLIIDIYNKHKNVSN